MNNFESKKQENPLELETPTTDTLDNFWSAIKSGHFELLSDDQINNIINEIFLKYPSITELSEQEEASIIKDFSTQIKIGVNSDSKKFLAEHPLIYIDKHDERLSPEDLKIICDQTDNFSDKLIIDLKNDRISKTFLKSLVSKGFGPLSKSEKIKILSDYHLHDGNGTHYVRSNKLSGIIEMGAHHIENYWLGGENITDVLTRIKSRTKSDHLRVLDVGGYIGMPLNDIKIIDKGSETFNLTVHEEPAMYPTDHLMVCPAEHMPKSLEGNIDLAISLISFRYHTYPDISLRNVVLSLSHGGEAFIDFDAERSSARKMDPEDFKKRIQALFNWLKSLEEKGEIKTNIKNPDIAGIAGGNSIRIHIVKN